MLYMHLHEGGCRGWAAGKDVSELECSVLKGADLECQRGKAQHRHQSMMQHGPPAHFILKVSEGHSLCSMV